MIDSTVVAAWDDERAWPNFSQTAALLHLDRSALTKQARSGRVLYVAQGMGRGARLVPPAEVVRLARIYRRVPVDDVVTNLAYWMADRVPLDAEDVLAGLRRLTASDAAWEEPHRPRVVKLGRLVPRKMDEDEFPAPGLAEALASRRPVEPGVRILDRQPRVVRLGRLRPGERS